VEGRLTSTSRGIGPGFRPLVLGETSGESAGLLTPLRPSPPPAETRSASSASSTIILCNKHKHSVFFFKCN
jgi:hypothetical protein